MISSDAAARTPAMSSRHSLRLRGYCPLHRGAWASLTLLCAGLLAGWLSPGARAADTELKESLLLASNLEAFLRQPASDGDYSQLELLARTPANDEVRLELPPEESWRLIPRFHALEVTLPREDFLEFDTDRPRLTTSALDADDQRSVVGGRLLTTRRWREAGCIETEARLLWLCEFIKCEAAPTAFFSPGTSNVFATQGFKYGSNWAMVGTRVRWQIAEGLSVFAGYDAQVNSLEMFHIGSTGLGYSW